MVVGTWTLSQSDLEFHGVHIVDRSSWNSSALCSSAVQVVNQDPLL
jgi:hypothetical protein